MRRTIIIYGIAMALLLGALKFVEYKYFVREVPLEYYIGLVAVLFGAVGVWAGLKLTSQKVVIEAGRFEREEENVRPVSMSIRGIEVLELLAVGIQGKERADKIYV